MRQAGSNRPTRLPIANLLHHSRLWLDAPCTTSAHRHYSAASRARRIRTKKPGHHQNRIERTQAGPRHARTDTANPTELSQISI